MIVFFKSLKNAILPLDFWAFTIIMVLVLMPPIGSLGSITIGVMSIVGWVAWRSYRADIRLLMREKWAIAIALFYVFSALFFSALHAEKISEFAHVSNNLGILVGLSLLPILRLYAQDDLLEKIVIAVAASGIILATATISMMIFGVYNFELLSGNALILAYLAGLNAVFGLIFFVNYRKYSWLSFFGVVGSIFAVAMTLRRGPTVALIVAFLPIFIFAIRNNFQKFIIVMVCIAAIGSAALAYNKDSIVAMVDIDQVSERISNPFNTENMERRIYLRFVMYRDGWAAFKNAPLTGYGRENVVAAAAEQNVSAGEAAYVEERFSHLHNAFLTDAVASGILGILGLLGMYLIPVFLTWHGPRMVRLMGISYSVYFFACGLTNIGFYQDVMIFSYVFNIAILNMLSSPKQADLNYS